MDNDSFYEKKLVVGATVQALMGTFIGWKNAKIKRVMRYDRQHVDAELAKRRAEIGANGRSLPPALYPAAAFAVVGRAAAPEVEVRQAAEIGRAAEGAAEAEV